MKKKVLYLSEWKMQGGDGISKKINSQLIAMKHIVDVHSLFINEEVFYFNGQKIKYWPFFYKRISKFIQAYKVVNHNKYDFVYVRNIAGINSILFFIVTLMIKKTKFIIEIPTYPFNNESSRKSFSSFVFNKVTTLYKYTISHVTYMGDDARKIWGIDAIKLDNAVIVNDYKRKKDCEILPRDCFHIIGVSSLAFWHGYDRIIESIRISKCNVIFHVVGDGPELLRLQSMVNKFDISKLVKFYGRLDGEKLDAVFDVAHIAVDSIGRHRSGNEVNSSIKSKEYTARGIPFIKSHIDLAFEGCEFVKNVSPDESLIDLAEIKLWCESLALKSVDIRKFAVENLQWEQQIDKLPFNRAD